MEIKNILKTLKINKTGTYDNQFYVIELENSNEYARMYTLLGDNALNTEYPNFKTNTNNTVTKITNYFELDNNNITYNIFLVADFDTNKYYIRIGEK